MRKDEKRISLNQVKESLQNVAKVMFDIVFIASAEKELFSLPKDDRNSILTKSMNWQKILSPANSVKIVGKYACFSL